MPNPPLYPLKDASGVYSSNYFQQLANWSAVYLKPHGIELNFKGYTETISNYANLDENATGNAWKLAKELNAWAEYFSSISNLIQKLFLDANTEKMEIFAIASIQADNVKVANGERLANKNKEVVEVRKKRNTLQAFHDELQAKVRFLERAHYHCKATSEAKHRMNSGILPTVKGV